MATEQLKNIQNARDLKTALSTATADLKKLSDSLVAVLGESIKTFEKNELKTRREYNQLKIDEMKAELKKRGIVENKIEELEKLHLENRYREFNKHYEKTKKALKFNLTELEIIEKKQMQQRIVQNKEFYGKVDASFKKFNEGVGKMAGSLDSMFGTKAFTLLSKVGNLFSGVAQNAFKLAMGGAKFIKNWREEGVGAAFKQTKIGQGFSKAGQALRTGADFLSGKSADEKRAERDKERKDLAAQDQVAKAARGTTEAIRSEGAAEEKQRKKWWAWEIMKFMFLKTLDIGKALLGLGTAPWIKTMLKWMGPVAIGVVVGLAVKKMIDDISSAISRSAELQIKAIKEQTTKEKEMRDLGKEKWQHLGLSPDQERMLTAQAAQSLLKKDKLYAEQRSRKVELDYRFNKGDASEKEIAELDRLNYFLRKKEEQEKNRIYRKRITGDKQKEIAFDEELRRYNQASIAQRKTFQAQEEDAELRRKAHERAQRHRSIFTDEAALEEKYYKEYKGIGDDTYNLDNELASRGVNPQYFPMDEKSKYQDVKKLINGVLNKSKRNEESYRTLTIPPSTEGHVGRKGKSISLAPGVNYDGLRADVKDKFTRMSDEYYDKTGNLVGVNSAYRSLADQIRLYNEQPDKAARPGRSPHQFGYAIDANSWNLNEMDSMGLLDKYGFERRARTRSGELETWHVTPKGATHEVPQSSLAAVKTSPTEVEAGDDVFTEAAYMNMGKKFAESVSYAFTKDAPGRAIRDMQKTMGTGTESSDTKEMIKLLTDIKVGIDKSASAASGKTTETKSTVPASAPSPASGGSVAFKTQKEIFPSDTLMTNMYALLTQFSGGY